MSRLADILTGMDRGAARPVGVGQIAGLAAAPARNWRRAVLFAIVIVMLIASAAVVLPLARVTSTAPVPPVPARPPAPAVAAPTKPMDEPFDALLSRGLDKARQDALPEAAELLREALALRPADAETWNSLGVVLVRQGQTERGVDAFTRALRLTPSHAEAHRNLAVALDRQGRSEAAADHYRAFLRACRGDHPARDDVRRRLEQISPVKGAAPESLAGASGSR